MDWVFALMTMFGFFVGFLSWFGGPEDRGQSICGMELILVIGSVIWCSISTLMGSKDGKIVDCSS